MKKIISVCTLFAVAISMAAACTNEVEEPFENNVKNETQTIAVSSAEQNEIDLGLPSGTRWAEANLGAESETEPGLYYAWGDTNGYTKDSGHEFSISAYTESDSYPYAIFNNINITRDAANKRLGGSWRMPTKEECQELLDNCKQEQVSNYKGTGVNGCLFTSKINGKTLFMPDCGYCDYSTLYFWNDFGYYWCSSYDNSTSKGYVFDTGLGANTGRARRNGCPIRAVYSSGVVQPIEHIETIPKPISLTTTEQNAIDLGLPSGLKWAQGNLGAEEETDPGLYYAWGETTGYAQDSDVQDSLHVFSSANHQASSIHTNLTLAHDAANVRLGGSWRMPTKAEFEELKNNTNITETTIDGVNGVKFTSKTDASKYIFLPRTGYYNQQFLCSDWEYGEYWCSTYSGYDSYYGWHFGDLFCIDDFDICQMAGKAVWAGCVIWAVCE